MVNKKKLILFLIATLIIFNSSFLIFINTTSSTETNFYGEIEIHFIDVGQADSTLIKTEESKILIDAGDWRDEKAIEYLEKLNISKVDLLIGTHPHADHIGQMDLIIENFVVKEIWMSGSEQDSEIYRRVEKAIERSNAIYREPRLDQKYQLNNITIEILNPPSLTDDIHESGLAMKVIFRDFSVMFTGDIEVKTEKDMVERNSNFLFNIINIILPKEYQIGNELEVDIYQVGHHGSRTSSTSEFLEAMDPEIGIYSAGKDNRHGHPHEEVVERFEYMGIPLYGTDEYGTIIIKADSIGEFEIYIEE